MGSSGIGILGAEMFFLRYTGSNNPGCGALESEECGTTAQLFKKKQQSSFFTPLSMHGIVAQADCTWFTSMLPKQRFAQMKVTRFLLNSIGHPHTRSQSRSFQSKKHTVVTRRRFLGILGTSCAVPLIVPQAVLGLGRTVAPNSRIVFGGIGMGNRAMFILPNFLAFPEVQFVAVSDAREDRRQAAKKAIDIHYGNGDCRVYRDFCELLAQPDIDAVLIATGNRWHATASMFASKAGKDIYCEKPISLTIREGRQLVEMCRRYGTVYQAGTQRRSTESYQFAREVVRRGLIGRVHTVEMQVWTGGTVPHQKPTPVPPGWDYDQWLGPVQWRPFVPGRVNGWMYFWDTGEGVHTDMGTHYTDQMQWVLGTDDTGPVEFWTSDIVWPDPKQWMSETAISGTFYCRYANGVQGILYQRKGFTDRYIRYIGENGWVQVDDETDLVTAEPKSILNLKQAGGVSWANAGAHIRNFLDCVKSRKATLCNPEVAHRAQTICEAMTISARLNRRLKWDPVKEVFDCEEANRMLYREPRAPWRVI